MNTNSTNEMDGIVQAACAFESMQRHVSMEPNDLRVQELASELIFLAGEDVDPNQEPD
jgi:hypothetical protein